ncbi:dehydratase [Halorubrum sp. JWXQ-INN 858]|uniref:FAS1-like dehydratase domain-containing protein n=1 Tax=Halorubrum sp. JWXQ-INN 858 TaxID=2690782 RepID=UPI00135B0F20|nr:MaoC family dehydratase N-terminal domain-containing protein [Halorubrum sp. JWXQ-INN 858]MWV64567.1 dehydratase [Halorubrum sp. JWXQ-INN 858]
MPSTPLAELESRVGERRRTVDGLVVERGKVAEFARAIGCTSDVFYDPDAAIDAGYADVPAPLTFTRTAYFPRNLAEGVAPPEFGMGLGFDPERTVHGEQAYEYDRPVVAGDVLDATTALADVYTKSGSAGTLTFAVLGTEYTDADGERVLAERRTRIERGKPAGEPNDPSDDDPSNAGNGDDENGNGEERGGEERGDENGDEGGRPATDGGGSGPVDGLPAVGTPLPRFAIEDVSRRDVVRYLGASGDFNPLHYDGAFARRGGHDDVVVPGMYVSGVASAALTDWVPLRRVRDFRTRFVSVAYPGGDLTVTGEVTAVDDGTSTATVEFTVANEAGDAVVTGDATVGR